ncbi:ATP-dependent zinc metalloprotease YME1L isoform X2 [Contarinia nasturtii]|uniref:ATP-dependent zinc metalloprotease YME1L isoform X2 n=1 Tax=Contarinia nasturtii TaxID=265458 RepID=UPI0012D3A485|nr:ATP-dependent zinc metalloprotease YME1L isoform X2 [Contarinia nasturtii]
MFSLQAYNQQILFHLSQITPRRHTIRIKESKPERKTNQINQNEFEQLCQQSLCEAVRNFQASPNTKILELPISVIMKQKPLALKHTTQTKSAIKNLTNFENTLRMSYVSKNSFRENKSEPIHDVTTESLAQARTTTTSLTNNFLLASNLMHHLSQPISNRTMQIRGFKTQRNIESQLKRNPTFLTRIQKSFDPLSKVDIGNTSPKQREVLTKILAATDNDATSGDNQKQRIKLAFAEGYLAANTEDKLGIASKLVKITSQIISLGLFIAILYLLFSAQGSIFRMQLGPQIEVDPEEISVKFSDVKGCDEAKQELHEIVEFLKNPSKFSQLGGKLPKGVLLVGPPGTGKTLLARAVAGEAGVPFFHAAGSEFDEMFVGQGARRIRDLFKAAKDRAPCVIFVDEIDSVGGKRTNSVVHPYANQTINQLLSEMDGFHQNEGVIVLGATNRRNDLDKALLRPGRFDVEVSVPVPDFVGRQQIIALYLKKVLHRDVDIDQLARGTTGFTGADLENMINQAALRAAIDGADVVTMKHFENARDKIIMGPERKSRLPDEEANEITAYHEAGHAIVGYYTKDASSLHKVTIIPRGQSLGHTAYLPKKEHYHVTKSQLLAMMDTMMGGRAAEELIFGSEKVTAGAGDDLKRATKIAHNMVKDLGMSDKFGLRTIKDPEPYVESELLGPNTTELIDAEIKRIMTESYERAKSILKTHAKEHKALAEALLKYETLDAEDIKSILTGAKKATDSSN